HPAAQQDLLKKASRAWNLQSGDERARRGTLGDFRAELTKLSTPAAAAPAEAATPQQQAVKRAESLFSAYKDQSQLALDAAHAQGRYDMVDVVGDAFSGKHLNP